MRVPPSPHHTPGPREKSGRGGAWTRAGASSRWQQRAAAPPLPAAPPRCHPASPHHGCRALLFRFARLGIRDPRRASGFMNRSQGPWQGPLAPDAGQEVGPGAGRCSPKPGGDALPSGAGSPRAAPALPPCGPHPLWAPEPLGWSSWGRA